MRKIALFILLLTLTACSFFWDSPNEIVFAGSGPVTEYSTDFCGTTGGWSGGQNISCLYNATGAYSQFFSPWSNTCTECNVTFWVNSGNFSSGNAKFYYATNNGSLANERYYCRNNNASHLKCSPEPGYNFDIGYIPKDRWYKVVIFLNYTSGNSTVYIYNETGSEYSTTSGSKIQKTFTTTAKFFAVDTGGWNDHFWFTNFSVVDTLGSGGSGSGGGYVEISGPINFSLKSPLNNSVTSDSSVMINFTVWSFNGTAGTSISGNTTYVRCGFTSASDTCNASGGTLNTTTNVYESLANFQTWTFGPFNQSRNNWSWYNITAMFFFVNASNDKFYPQENLSTTTFAPHPLFDISSNRLRVREEPGFAKTINARNGSWEQFSIVVNRTGNGWIAFYNATANWSNTTTVVNTVDGNYIRMALGGQKGYVRITNITFQILSSEANSTTTAGNSTVNVSIYAENGTLLSTQNAVANGSSVTYNWTGIVTGRNGWYATIRSPGGAVLNVSGLSFNKTASTPPGNISIAMLNPTANTSVGKNSFFEFSINVTCSGGDCGNQIAYLDPVNIQNHTFPMRPGDDCGSGVTCDAWIQRYADALWNDTVVCDFNTAQPMCAVVWYQSGSSNADSNIHSCVGTRGDGGVCNSSTIALSSKTTKRVPFVTDEGGNGLLVMSFANNQTRFELLWNFTKFIQHPSPNNLQCWAGYINGTQSYTNYSDFCTTSDSASDASLRILGALSISCAKQRAGIWTNVTGGVDYCADFVQQGKRIWGNGYTGSAHGEVKALSGGRYFLCNGYNNQPSCPTNFQAFRPDYYEIWSLMDWAEYMNNDTLVDGVIDMLEAYNKSASVGGNNVHLSKTGRFSSDGISTYTCDEGPGTCGTPNGTYTDSTDTWRAFHAIAALVVNHPEQIPSNFFSNVYDKWWLRYGGGNTTYCATCAKPTQIYSNSSGGGPAGNPIKETTDNFKVIGMWMPIGIYYNSTYVNDSIHYLNEVKWDGSNNQFYSTGYMDAYSSTFPIRAVALSMGYMSHNYYAVMGVDYSVSNGTKNIGQLVSTTPGDTPFYTVNSNPQDGGCLDNMTSGDSCVVTWSVNATGNTGNSYIFFAYTEGDTGSQVNSTLLNITITTPDTTKPSPSTPVVSVTNQTASIAWTVDEATSITVEYGTTPFLGSEASNGTLSTTHNITLSGLDDATYYYYSREDCDFSGNCNSTGSYNFTTLDSTPPSVVLTTPTNDSNVTTPAVIFGWVPTDNANGNLSCGIYMNQTGSMVLNTTVNVTSGTAGISSVPGFSTNRTVKWNVQCTDATGNAAFATQNYTFRFVDSLVSAGITLCPNILTLQWNANISLGQYDAKTRTFNQSGILPVNNSVCGWTYKLNNSGGSPTSVTFATNYTDSSGNFTMLVNGTRFNSTTSKVFSVPASTVYYVNITVNLTNYPILRPRPPASVTVS